MSSHRPVAGALELSDVGPNGTYVNPMGIPITVDYPKDWFAQSVSQSADPGNPNGPTQLGLVVVDQQRRDAVAERCRPPALVRCPTTRSCLRTT